MKTELAGPLTIGDHAVLDFLNTLPMVNGELADALKTEDDVVEWLRGAGLLADAEARPRAGILALARRMRETIRVAVERRKAGKAIDVEELNAWLKESRSWLKLKASRSGVLVRRRWRAETNAEILGPLVEMAAKLLAEGEFELIRRCEGPECVLWFYDRTKSHRRRWCSAAGCGNKNKVAAFRERQRVGVGRSHVSESRRGTPAKSFAPETV